MTFLVCIERWIRDEVVCCLDICHCISGALVRYGCKMVPSVRACGIGIGMAKSVRICCCKKAAKRLAYSLVIDNFGV